MEYYVARLTRNAVLCIEQDLGTIFETLYGDYAPEAVR